MKGLAELDMRSLTRDERRFVLRALVCALGAQDALGRLSASKRRVDRAAVSEALEMRDWPGIEATSIELAGMSKSLESCKCPRLRTYSLFWSGSRNGEVWIGWRPERVRNESMSLSGRALIDAVSREYGIRLIEHRESDGFISWVKRNRRRMILTAVLLVAPLVGFAAYSFLKHGFSARALWMPGIFLVSYTYNRYGSRYLSGDAHSLGWPLTWYFVSPYIFDDVEKYDPTNLGVDYPHMSGLAVSLALGFFVVISKSLVDDRSESLADMIRNRFSSVREVVVVMSVVTVTGYTAYLVHAYVLYLIFVEGHWIFTILLAFGVVAFSEFLLGVMRRRIGR